MTSRERVHMAIAHQEADRIAIHDGPWGTTTARWHQEGLPEGVSPQEHFGFEFVGISTDTTMQLPIEVVEETDEYVVRTTADGAVQKNWKGRTSTPELIDFNITTRAIWEEHKPRLEMNDSRVNWDGLLESNDSRRDSGLFRTMSFPGFTRLCNMVGPKRFLIAMAEEPEWTRDMFLTQGELCVAVAEAVLDRGIELDAGWIYDDLGFRQRSFMSPAMYRDQVWPAHKMICDCFKKRGMPMLLHSCGYVMNLIPHLIDAGFDVIQPLEVKAGNDMLGLKRDFGDRLAFMGGIDVRSMADPDPAAIEHEISSKIPIMKQGGGYIYHSDHSVPDNVSFDQYCRVMELVAEHGSYG